MEAINENIQMLLTSIKRSSVYQEYKKYKELIDRNQELKVRVDQMRTSNFKLFNETDNVYFFEKADQLHKESAELRSFPEVNAYLDAELALCRMMQEICGNLIEGINMDIPEL